MIINCVFVFMWTCVFVQVLMMDIECDPVLPDRPVAPPSVAGPACRTLTGRGALAGPQDPAPTHLGPRTMFEHLPTVVRSEGRACYSLQSIPVGQCGLDRASLLSNNPYACKLCPIASAGASVIRTNIEPQLLTEWILSACSKLTICLSIWMCEDETSQSDFSIWCDREFVMIVHACVLCVSRVKMNTHHSTWYSGTEVLYSLNYKFIAWPS